MSKPFNPLDMHNLAASIVTCLEKIEPIPLDEVAQFNGAGIYALYYVGAFPAYLQIAERNISHYTEPIHVGKAVPPGGRCGITAETRTMALFKRLNDHVKSIRAAENLDIADFHARWLVMEDIWIPLGESVMIRRYAPVWNAVLDGFGNHDPGKGRINGVRSKWDTLHPGRPWAAKFPPNPESAFVIRQEVTEYLRSRLA